MAEHGLETTDPEKPPLTPDKQKALLIDFLQREARSAKAAAEDLEQLATALKDNEPILGPNVETLAKLIYAGITASNCCKSRHNF
jgi:hypothetical protein